MGIRTLMTLEEFQRLPDDGMRHELNRGEPVVMPPASSLHSVIAQRINRALSKYVYEREIGQVLSEAGYRLSSGDPQTVRVPDVSFIGAERAEGAAEGRYFEGGPELAIEVVSPSDTAADLEEKIGQYFSAGSKAVWVVYPKTRAIRVYRPGGASVLLQNDDVLEAPDLFPGWSVRVAELLG